MEKRILDYRRMMDELLTDWEQNGVPGQAEEAKRRKEEHLTQIGFFSHERLVHLIVTVTFALLEVLALVLTAVSGGMSALLLAVALLVLLVPYIRHYYILENEVQKMYWQYDRIVKLEEKCRRKTF